MGVASIVLGVVSMICAVAGFILSWVPFLGGMLSFLSPLLALIGIVLGGVAMSRAREDGVESGIPLAGLIVSIVAFFPGFLVAITCGVCNSLCSAGALQNNGPSTQPAWYLDGGYVNVSPGITPVPAPPVPGLPAPIPGTVAPGTVAPGTVAPTNPGFIVPGDPTQPPDPNTAAPSGEPNNPPSVFPPPPPPPG